MKTQLTIAAAVLTLAACTPKFYPPQIATPESYVYGAGFSSDTTGVGERWWELFGDTTHDAHPPRRRPRAKHHSRLATMAATASPMAATM